MAEQGLIALQVIMQGIAQGDNDTVRKYIDMININTLSIERLGSLFNRLLTAATEYNNTGAIKVIISAFEPNYMDRYQLPLLNQVLIDQGIEDEVAAFVINQYPEHSYLELASKFIEFDADPNIMAGFVRLDQFKGPLEVEEYRHLLELAQGEENTVAEEFFAYQLNHKAPYAEIPEWVKNYTGEEELPYEDELIIPTFGQYIFDIPESTDQITDILTEGLRALGKSSEEIELAQMELRKHLTGASLEQKREALNDALENKAKADLADNEELFALFGPANLIVDADLANDESECCKYGGCRMFTCIEFEDFLDPSDNIIYKPEEYSTKDWFTGACQFCHLRIRRLWHAIRKPLDHGGWKGCYCSAKCIRDELDTQTDPNPLVSALLDKTVEELKRIGIQDRLSRHPQIPTLGEEEEDEN